MKDNLIALGIAICFVSTMYIHKTTGDVGIENLMRVMPWLLLLVSAISFFTYLNAGEMGHEWILDNLKRTEINAWIKWAGETSTWAIAVYMAWIGLVWSSVVFACALILAYMATGIRNKWIEEAESSQ